MGPAGEVCVRVNVCEPKMEADEKAFEQPPSLSHCPP